MEGINKLKEEIIERYNMSWDSPPTTDNLGVIQACKSHFKEMVEKLVNNCIEHGEYIKTKYSLDE